MIICAHGMCAQNVGFTRQTRIHHTHACTIRNKR
nr:MAG TPA: hypothetical protein [Caudoviricetes sp.]